MLKAVASIVYSLYGRLSVEQLVKCYNKEVANIEEPSILIRINQLFHYGMTPMELYDATRSCWRIGEDRKKVKYAFAVFDGIVQEVYIIRQWFKGGETLLSIPGERDNDRWEFVGNIAPKEIRTKYLNKSVNHYSTKGNQSPIIYVNIKKLK